MAKGVLYGVSVGPGDPQLLTLKAVETIAACPVVAAPRTRDGAMVALEIVRGALDLAGKDILPLDFAMSRDAEERAASHRVSAEKLRERLDAGQSVALLNLGDVSVYASYRYLDDILAGEGYATRMIPGVTSFCAAAAALGVSLTDMRRPLCIVPDGGAMADGFFDPGTSYVFMKSGRNLPALLGFLEERGLLASARVVQNVGLPDEKIYRSVEGREINPDYFTVVLLKSEGEARG